ncbi:unnamed protein product, partial [Phaeothamnion confervicola]
AADAATAAADSGTDTDRHRPTHAAAEPADHPNNSAYTDPNGSAYADPNGSAD